MKNLIPDKKQIFASSLAAIAMLTAPAAVLPQTSKHSKISGSTEILTNTVAYIDSVGQEILVSTMDALSTKLDNSKTNEFVTMYAITNKNVSDYVYADSNSIAGKLNNTASRIRVITDNFELLDGDDIIWSCNTNELLGVAMSATTTYCDSKTDYALTNFTGAAVEADAYTVTLQSGEIGNVTLGAGTNLAVTLTFPAANNRSCDCGILVINAADCVLDVGPSETVDVLGTEWGTIKAGTNLVYMTRVKYDGNKSVVSVTTKEVK